MKVFKYYSVFGVLTNVSVSIKTEIEKGKILKLQSHRTETHFKGGELDRNSGRMDLLKQNWGMIIC